MRWYVRGRDPHMTLALVQIGTRGSQVFRTEDFRGGLTAARAEVRRRNDLRREAETADRNGRTPPPMIPTEEPK